MKIIELASKLRPLVTEFRRHELSVGFVPTMGNLHAGHLALVDAATTQCDRVIVSIFVNPLQFGPDEDLDAYPNTPEEDQRVLRDHGVSILFRPTVKDVYPVGLQSQTRVIVPILSDTLEGLSRPGHLDGVTTVVNRLFNQVQADKAFFGKKDYQQYQLIRKMVADLAMNVEIIGIDTIRLGSGLALSSRNNYLSTDELKQAADLNRVIHEVAAQYSVDSAGKIITYALAELKKNGFITDYLAVRRQGDLNEPGAGDENLVVLVAVWLGKTRLIDNLEFLMTA